MICTCAVVKVRRVKNNWDMARLRRIGNPSESPSLSFFPLLSRSENRSSSFVLCFKAQMPETMSREIIGVARRNSGMFENVQYRNRPTFLLMLEALRLGTSMHTNNAPERRNKCLERSSSTKVSKK